MKPKFAALFAAAALIAVSVAVAATARIEPAHAAQTTCFKTGEQVSGSNKICYYSCLGNTVAINVRAVELCPLSIRRDI